MKHNKYLKEIGIEWYDLPGTYQDGNENKEEINDTAAGDCRNQEDNEGFCGYEFFNLDYTLNLFIYSKLCYFREYIADLATPGCLISHSTDRNNDDQQKDNKLWKKILDEMIDGFKVALIGDLSDSEVRYKITHARRLLAEYWDCLWY